MTRLPLLLIAVIATGFALVAAPAFVVNVIACAAVLVFGARWFVRAAGGRGHGARWRR